MHLDDGELQAVLHDERGSTALARAHAHAQACSSCRARLDAAAAEERELFNLLAALDRAMPSVGPEQIIARHRSARGIRQARLRRWAAGLALVVASSGVAYASTDGAVRRWIARALLGRDAPTAISPVPADPVTAPDPIGVALAPGSALVIEFTRPQTRSGGGIQVTLVDTDLLEVQAPYGAASFETRTGRLIIDNRDEADLFELRLPRSAPSVEIRLGARSLFRKSGTLLSGGGAIAGDQRLVPLAP